MVYIALAFAVLAAGLHVIIFVFVVGPGGPRSRSGAGSRWSPQDQAELTRPLAFNQGFYNLFLAVGTFVGVVCVLTGTRDGGLAP